MRKRLQKWASKGIVTGLAIALLAACSSTTNNPAPANNKDNSQVQEGNTAPTTQEKYTLYHPHQTTPINLNGPITKEIMDNMGFNWEKVEIGNGSDIAQQVNLKLVGGNFPDVILLAPDSPIWSRLIDEDRVLALDDYFNQPEQYPNLAKIDKRIIDSWRASDGHIYFIPSFYEPVVEEPSAWQGNAQGLWIQSGLAEQAGLSVESLGTIEGLEAYLAAVKQMKDPQGRDMIPLSLGGENFAGLEYVMSMFGVRLSAGGTGWNEQADGSLIPDYQTEGFKQAFQWLNKLHLQGLIDPETSFHKRDLFLEKTNSLRFGAMIFNGWDNPNLTILANNDLPASITYSELEKQGFPEGWFVPLKLPAVGDIKPVQHAYFNPFGGMGTGISKDVKNPEALIKGLDWLHTPEAFILMEYGPESMGAYKMEDGVVVVNQDVFQGPEFWGGDGMANATEKGFWWWKQLGSTIATHIPTLEAPWTATNAMLYKAEQLNQEQGTFGLIPAVNRTKARVGGSVEKYSPVQNDIRMQYYAKLLLAKNEAEFDTIFNQFLNEMKVRGHDEETIAEFNAEYQAYIQTPAGQIEIDVKRTMPRNVFSDKAEAIGR